MSSRDSNSPVLIRQMNPLVSICIPTYNGESFIEQALSSVLNQTYSNLEIIISDDNSEDRTVEISKIFRDQSSFTFKIFEHEQYGLSQNWNFCISQSKGKYIKFLFQDDLLEPDAITQMVALAEQDNEIGLVFSPRNIFIRNGDNYYNQDFLTDHGARDVHKDWSQLKTIQSGRELLEDPNLFNYSINKFGEPTTVLIRKDMFNRVGYFNSNLCQLVDLEMWLRIISECKVGYIDRYLSHFRLHENQQTNRNIADGKTIDIDMQEFFNIIYNDTRYPEDTRKMAFYRYSLLADQKIELSIVRKELAKLILAYPDNYLEDMYQSMIGRKHEIALMPGSFKATPLELEESNLIIECRQLISQGLSQPGAIKSLLILMIYYRADQLQLPYDLSHIPNWLLPSYFLYLFASPVDSYSQNTAEEYYSYLKGWINYLHSSIFNNISDQFWQDVVNWFAKNADFTPAYFKETNVKWLEIINANNRTSPLVSICIPVYNGDRFITETINSALSQTYPNIEIILSDDDSSDRTVEIAKSFQLRSPHNFSILKHDRNGLAANWNFCISQAQGKYIKFLFQDDILQPNAIAEMVALAEQDNSIGLVFSPRELFTSTDNLHDAQLLANHEAKDLHKAWSKLSSVQAGQELLQDINILENPINKIGEPSTVLIRKEVFDTLGGFDPDLCQLVDLEMWLRIMSQYKIGFIDRTLSSFRIHSQQQTQQNSSDPGKILLDYQRLFNKIANNSYYPQPIRHEALYKYEVLNTSGTSLQQSRIQFANFCLNLSDEQLASLENSLSIKTHKMLCHSRFKGIIYSIEEQTLVDKLRSDLEQGLDQPNGIQKLLAVMLFYRADQLNLKCDLRQIPDWFMTEYLRFLFAVPVKFENTGEADNYYDYLTGWLQYLHESILGNPSDQFWQNIASIFVELASFIAVYFSDFNLKNIYVQRADIIDFVLKTNGFQPDHIFEIPTTNTKKIRLGVLSAHYAPSAETFAALPIYEYLSREFEVILYSLEETNHHLEQYCHSCANSFKLLPKILQDQVDIIRADDLDILFFVNNVTTKVNQIGFLAAHRLARIQITSGGSVVTTGLKSMDYFISGTFTDPAPIAQEQYSEKLILLPGTAHCFSYGNDYLTSEINIKREDLNISSKAIVFSSGANFFKIVPELINAWAKIISQVPNSVLMLLPYGSNWSNSYPKHAFKSNILKVFAQHGVSPDRLIIVDPQHNVNRADVKEYYRISDIYLDSYPFSGTTSFIEPLQVHLPIIARQGNCFRSAMGAAMIQSLGVTDLVADSEESYIQLAVNLGNNLELRQQKRAEVQAKMQSNPSFLDSRSYSAKIGKLFIDLFAQYSKNAQNESLQLRDMNLMVFPDWNQSEESVGYELQQVIQTLATQPNAQNTTLLIDTTNIATEDAQMFLSSIAMNIMMEEDLDITEELGISLIEDLNNIQWENLLPRINSRILMDCDDQETIENSLPKQLMTSSLLNLSYKIMEESTDNIAVKEMPPVLKFEQDNVHISLPQQLNTSTRLHIGGQEHHPDWKIFDALPREEVDFIGNAQDLSQFENNSISAIYTSHVLEHFYYLLNDELLSTLKEWYRVLETGGELMISVPNLQVICSLYVDPRTPANDRYSLMRMIFGGQLNEYDVHKVGFDQDILGTYLQHAGFHDIQVVSEFGLFDDCSSLLFGGIPVSLNMIAKK
jgi:predicted O-linked N-acetylglucosamine transferase (SPINDLY family)/predicted SAM-dependent methyltransferase/GT2 family glycosyltransferase